ncbi:benzyl alcohol O-benzoyltransferase-like protein [Carex littledalei]|uniref:Benzyl alcohol O-benzoyltransferase-like protein n=1 Tax=Carex littledalei TaxID=544730 RepID=A0A833R1L8_9POAL|nr:benzyl alcohol O-benzoyltransferase-like protein [Carex littledalei]
MASHKTYPSSVTNTFTVQKTNPVLIVPAEPTPYEFKPLSDIDDQDGLRFYATGIHLYKDDRSKEGQDPARVIRDALAKALVYYYPISGRLREEVGRKLVVECNGQGVVFVEAQADVRVEDFGEAPSLPIPGAQQLLYGPENFGHEVTDQPLLYIQVTRFKCGGFAFGLQICHVIADAPGVVQFLTAIAELARDNTCTPSVTPVWDRHLLSASSTPLKSQFSHLEYHEPDTPNDTAHDIMLTTPADQMLHQSFFFSPKQMLALRKCLPLHLRAKATNFELITAAVWQSRAIALDYKSDLEVRVLFVVNARGKRKFRELPKGFYGNALVFPVARATTAKLKERPLGYALKLVRQAKEMASDEFLQSAMDLLVTHDRPHFVDTRTYLVSDVTRAGFDAVDFGWGGGVYGGPATAVPASASFFMKGRNERGEEGMVVPLCLPNFAMERFVVEMEGLMEDPGLDFYAC